MNRPSQREMHFGRTTLLQPRLLLLSIALISAAAISYEVLLIRLFSIIQWHHFAYMIISIALLGYGASGTFIAMAGPWLRRHVALVYLSSAAMMAFSMVGSFAAAQHLPFNPLEILWDPRQHLTLLALYLLLSVPFFCAANCIGLLLRYFRSRIGRIYCSDLLGGGVGALGVVLLLFIFPPDDCLKLIGTLGFFSAVLAVFDRAIQVPPWAAIFFISAGFIAPTVWPDHWVALHLSEYKGLSQTLQVVDTSVISESSSPLGLLTVVESPTIPFRYAPGVSLLNTTEPPPQLAVFTDGDGMSVMTRYDGTRESLGYLDQLSSALPYHLLNAPKVLIIGPGGGSDVLLARYHGAAAIDVVELNRQIVNLVRERYAEFAGNLYDEKNVRLYIADARGFVAKRREQYDLMQLSLLDSFSASSAGVHALSESYLYTVNAFEEYVRHLKPGGILAITRWLRLPPRDIMKMFATAVAALERSGVAEPGRRLVLIRSWNTATLLLKNGDFTKSDLSGIRRFSEDRAFDLAYIPGMSPKEVNRYNVLDMPYLFEGANALLERDRGKFLQRYKYYIAPSTDDRPYFYDFFKWRLLRETLSLRERGGLPLVEWGYPILCATLFQAVIVSFTLILLPLWRLKGVGPSRRIKGRVTVYFLALGLAFLFIEIAFIQKFVLFLSNPLYAVAVVLSSFLFFAGIGSGCSGRFAEHCKMTARAPIAIAVAGIILVASIYLFLLPPLFYRLIPLADLPKIIISIALIAPLAFCMGIPFPLGLSKVALATPEFIPWAWGINGCASVLSVALATLLAIHFGFTAVVILAMGLYLLAAVAMPKLVHPRN